ncbi:MAG: aminotransferase [Polyangia bacterium]
MARPALTRRLPGITTSVFAEMSTLARKHDAVNLGQGFPNFDGPENVKRAAIEAIEAGHNQYAPMAGVPSLLQAIAAHQKRFYGLDFDPNTEVTVYAGATEALSSTLAALLDPGDEVIVFDPIYDSYLPCIALAQAVPKVVVLEPPRFRIDAAAIDAVITKKTRALLLNSPSNPTGRVLSGAELEVIATACVEHDLIAITDEVYEHLVFEGRHVPLATLPGMRERCISISSGGKTFSLTGWKVGWSCAPPDLTAALRMVHQFVTFSVATPLQHAMAVAVASSDDYYDTLLANYRARRDKLCNGLAAIGFGVTPPEGTYFALGDIRPLGYDDDVTFCRKLVEEIGVAAIPYSAFGTNGRHRHLVRFAFCKDDATLDAGLERLARLRKRS